jgi:diguanylate cyclase (GGDEF)-like protein
MTDGRPGASPDGRDLLAGRAISPDGPATRMPTALYVRVARITGYVFLIAALAIVTLFGGTTQSTVYVLLALGLFLTVLFQEMLPPRLLGRLRVPLEVALALTFLTVLLILTGGRDSPYFFGYVLLLFAGALSAGGLWPSVLTLAAALAYVAGVLLAPDSGPFDARAVGVVTFNVVAFGLVAYVASAIGREERRAREEAVRLSRFDRLTALPNRDHFQSTVEQEILRASRTGRPFAVLMIDLDGLKAANDRFGHASGDRLLQAVADVLRSDTRATDLAARYAGDEFVLTLPDTDLPGALSVAEKVRVDIARLALPHDGALVRTSASIGLVTYPDDGRTSTELVRRADLAMYEAKRRGKDQIVRYARRVGVPAAESATPATGRAPQRSSGPGRRAQLRRPASVVPPASPGPAPWERS